MREASTKLFVTQPALSASIRELEDELGIVIFERTNKGITLTDDGREFITYAKKAVGQYMILEDRYMSRGGGKEKFSVSAQHYNFAIRAFTALIKKTAPGRYDFSFRETKTKEVLDDVADLRSEVGIISFSGSNEGLLKKLFRDLQLEFVPLMKRDTYIYVWKDHPLAGEKMLSLDDMKGWPCVSFDQSGDGNFYITEEAMADYPFDRTIRSGDRATTMEIIAELGGFSVGSGMLAEKGSVLSGMVAIKMKEDDPLTIGYITRVGRALSHYGEEYVKELLRFREL